MSTVKLGAPVPGLYPSTFTIGEIEEDKLERSSSHRHPWAHKPVENRVEYIHPEGRFATIRFFCGRGSFCESFHLRRDCHE